MQQPIQEWEYWFLTCHAAKGAVRVESVNGQEQQGWERGLTMFDYCNQLGVQGWELVSMTLTDAGWFYLAFKRPK
jgi:hypothetical protein